MLVGLGSSDERYCGRNLVEVEEEGDGELAEARREVLGLVMNRGMKRRMSAVEDVAVA